MYKRIDKIKEMEHPYRVTRIHRCIFKCGKFLNSQLYEESLHESRVVNYSNKQSSIVRFNHGQSLYPIMRAVAFDQMDFKACYLI